MGAGVLWVAGAGPYKAVVVVEILIILRPIEHYQKIII